MSEPHPFGLLHEITIVGNRIQRHVRSAQSDIYNAKWWLLDHPEDFDRAKVVELLDNAMKSLKIVSDA